MAPAILPAPTLRPAGHPVGHPAPLFAPTPKAAQRVLEFSPPTVKQHLAVLRMLFDWLVRPATSWT